MMMVWWQHGNWWWWQHGKLRLWWYDGKGEQTMMMTTRTLKPDRGKASRRTLRSRRQWQSETERQWQSEESRSALLDPTPLKMWDPTGSYPTQNKKWTVHCSAPNLPRSETPQVPLEGQSKPQQRLQITLKMIVGLPPPSRFNWLFKDYSQLPKKERLTENCNENAPLDPNLLLQKPHWLPLKDIQNFRRAPKKIQRFFFRSKPPSYSKQVQSCVKRAPKKW